jgi:F0F1-type ATP synthase assembly protein I
MTQDERPKRPQVADAASFLGHGLTWALSTALFLFLGWLLDGWIGTLPLFTILGAFVGAGAGFYSLYHHLVVLTREQNCKGDDEDE